MMLMTQKVRNLIEVSGCRITDLREGVADAMQRHDLCQQKIQQLRADLKVARLEAKLVVEEQALAEFEVELAAEQLAWAEFEDDVRGMIDSELKAAPLAS